MKAGKTTDSAEARLQLVLEHVQAEVDHDLDAIMRTWGENPRLDDVPWDEHWIGTDKVREHYEELLTTFPDLTIDVHEIYESDSAGSSSGKVLAVAMPPFTILRGFGHKLLRRRGNHEPG